MQSLSYNYWQVSKDNRVFEMIENYTREALIREYLMNIRVTDASTLENP